jgi:hypothetical protein
MPDEEAAAGGRQPHHNIDPSDDQPQVRTTVSPHWTHPEGGRDPSDYLEQLRKASHQPAPGSLEEDAAQLEAFRSYHSGLSNDARSTGEESAPPNAEFEYPDDGTGTYPRGRTRRTPRQQEQNKHVSMVFIDITYVCFFIHRAMYTEEYVLFSYSCDIYISLFSGSTKVQSKA